MLRVKYTHFHKIAIEIFRFACLHYRKSHTEAENFDEKNQLDMGRISKYKNDRTEASELMIDELFKKYQSITIEAIEQFQLNNGISDTYLSKAVGIDLAAISRWKKGSKPLSDTTLTALYFLMKEFNTLS